MLTIEYIKALKPCRFILKRYDYPFTRNISYHKCIIKDKELLIYDHNNTIQVSLSFNELKRYYISDYHDSSDETQHYYIKTSLL